MGLRALAAVIAVLDVFLGIVPGPATGGHGNCDEETGHDHTKQHRPDSGQR